MLWAHQAEMDAGSAAAENMIRIAVRPNTQEPGNDTAPIRIDFEALLRENADIVAWIYCPDTPINYPVVQSEDNSYYLRKAVNGTRNSAGTLFLDHRNADDFSDVNSVIYGHNMRNDSMFGTLTEYKDQEYYEQHPVIYLLTPENDYKVELFAGYTTPSDSAIYDIPMLNGKTAEEIMGSLASSTFTAETVPESGDHVLTLSTCSYEYDNARYVVTGVLKKLSKSG